MSIHSPESLPDDDRTVRSLNFSERTAIGYALNGLVGSQDSFEQRKADINTMIIKMIGSEKRSLLPHDSIEAAEQLLQQV
jgi:hypothetical protein